MPPIWIKDECGNYHDVYGAKKIILNKITCETFNSTHQYVYVLYIDDIKLASSETFYANEENTEKIIKRKKQLESYREIIAKFLKIEPLFFFK